ncbi:unnamed protein product [Jaminaea pallidilutea]
MTLLVLTALLFGALTLAEHYQCSWDVLQGKTPEAAGFTRLCEPKLVEIEQYGSYRCTLYASLNDHEYGIATWNAKPQELEWGPPCGSHLAEQYGNIWGKVGCHANSWLFCAEGECWGCDKSDDCAFKTLFATPPRHLSVWYKTNGS